MKVFISWSGDRSKFIANTLHWWLPNVMQAIDPFVSSQDIQKGAKGIETILSSLKHRVSE